MINKKVSIFTSEEEITKIKMYNKLEEELQHLFDKMSDFGYEAREGQLYYSDSVLNALKDENILLIEAGVGTGKTKGYLIPTLMVKEKDKNFKSVIISTSSKALQEQVAEEIKNTANLLGIEPPKTVVIKGKNNYICLNRMMNVRPSKINKQINNGILNGLIERKDYQNIKEHDWAKINITSCAFDSCYNANNCPYYKLRKEAMRADVIVCNHDLTIEHLKREDKKNNLFKVPNALIFDEAHTLEEKFRNAFKGELDSKNIQSTITRLCSSDILQKTIPTEFFLNLNSLYWETCNNSKQKLAEVISNNQDYTDCNRVIIEWSKTKDKKVKYILNYMINLAKEFTDYLVKNQIDLTLRENEELLKLKQELDNYIFMFSELSKTKEECNYILCTKKYG